MDGGGAVKRLVGVMALAAAMAIAAPAAADVGTGVGASPIALDRAAHAGHHYNLPPLFVVGTTGDAELVNYRYRAPYYVVDRLFGAAELRLGGDKAKVVRISRTDVRRGS